ncbi:MAG: hypothetical protein R3F31_25285 [Verrucomicrobiales bacterium]
MISSDHLIRFFTMVKPRNTASLISGRLFRFADVQFQALLDESRDASHDLRGRSRAAAQAHKIVGVSGKRGACLQPNS